MQTDEALINELSDICGIIPEYWDIFGTLHITSLETKKAILRSMGLKIDSPDGVSNEIIFHKLGAWKRFMEPVTVISVTEQPLKLSIYIPAPEGAERSLSVAWSIEDEQGIKHAFVLSGDGITISDRQWIDGSRYIKVDLNDRCSRDIGYYTAEVSCDYTADDAGLRNHSGTSKVIIAPDKAYMPPELAAGKTWGLSVNLYSVRSSRNWGIGDLTDLKQTVTWIAGLDGGFVGINPLHATTNCRPYGVSPYSPISRLYRNFIYLDISGIPEVMESGKAQSILASEGFKQSLNDLRDQDLIDYDQIAVMKEMVLRQAFDLFYEKHYKSDSRRGTDFERFVAEEGEMLESFSLFLALRDYLLHEQKLRCWLEWPAEYMSPLTDAIQSFKKEHEDLILFYKYIQWLIDCQLKEVAQQISRLAMPVGLYHDLAFGSVADGSDAWNYQNIVAAGIEVGAPPDDFNPDGQNWGFPPLIPERIREAGYDFFIQTIRKNMKYFGALRIDHALGMFRLFWIPRGLAAKEGAYVTYPSEDLLRIISLESVRNKTMVIAEDLGTITGDARSKLSRFNMLSYRLLYFERNYPDPSFTTPDRYPATALCAITTHDLPTLHGYWTGKDIEVKRELGMYQDDIMLQRHLNDRARDRFLILDALKSQGIIPNDAPSDPAMVPDMSRELCIALYEYLARTPCKLLSVSLDDVIGTLNQQNMPGILDTYPSWRHKISRTLDQLSADEIFSALAEMFRKNDR